jgi:hypothetical protein
MDQKTKNRIAKLEKAIEAKGYKQDKRVGNDYYRVGVYGDGTLGIYICEFNRPSDYYSRFFAPDKYSTKKCIEEINKLP